jgi:hypothetical protein
MLNISHETDIPEQIGIKPFAFHNYGYQVI